MAHFLLGLGHSQSEGASQHPELISSFPELGLWLRKAGVI